MKKEIICQNIKKEQFSVSPEKLSFRPSVYGLLVENGKILLSKQWDGYDFPGGGIEIDETVHEALKREFLEETGVEIEVLEPIKIQTSFFHPDHSESCKNEYWNSIRMYFLVKRIGGGISIANFDEDEEKYLDMPEWIDLNEVRNIKHFNTICISDVINQL